MSSSKSPRKRTASTPRLPRSNGKAPARRAKRSASLVEAPPEKHFWVNCGPVLRNLAELRDALAAGMSDEQFSHHVNESKNDFAAWVEQVLGDPQCARGLRKAPTRAAALRVVTARLGAAG